MDWKTYISTYNSNFLTLALENCCYKYHSIDWPRNTNTIVLHYSLVWKKITHISSGSTILIANCLILSIFFWRALKTQKQLVIHISIFFVPDSRTFFYKIKVEKHELMTCNLSFKAHSCYVHYYYSQ